MLFKDLNKVLDSEILSKAGFNFDGYYYINPSCPIKLNSAEGGFMANFIDESAPQLNQTISTYSELISMMVRTLNFTIEKGIANRQFANPNEQVNAMAEIVKRYFAFDVNINLVLLASPMGVQVNPNNEYTFTLVNGDIKQVKVYYEWVTPQQVNSDTIELEVAAQCISWPFLMKVIKKELTEFNNDTDKLGITKVVLINEDQEIPFFGMGIPTIHKNS